MRKTVFLILFLITIWLSGVNNPAFAEFSEPTDSLSITKSESLIIKYFDESDRQNVLDDDIKPLIKEQKNIAPDVDLINANNLDDKMKLYELIKEDSNIEFIENNKMLKIQTAPNDPYLSQQWSLAKIQIIDGWANMPPAQKNIKIAVIDSGIDLSHQDLINRIADRGYNFVSSNTNISDMNTNSHGTAVSGVIASETDNEIGITGVGGKYDIKILPLKTVNYSGYCYLSDVIKAIDYAIEQGVDVINLSLGSNKFSEIENATIQKAIESGIVVVASAGNEGTTDLMFPASYDNVISVGSINEQENVSTFSNHNSNIDVVAPGENMLTCKLSNSYGSYAGTSFSAPIVSGMAGLLKAVNPELTPLQIENIIHISSQDLGAPGRDDYYGYGLVNFNNAIDLISPTDITNNLTTNTSNKQIDLAWEEVQGSTAYNVYRSINPQGTYDKIGTTPDNHYSDISVLPATTYWYKISWSNPYTESLLSNSVTVTTDLYVPNHLTACTVGSKQIDLSWDATQGSLAYNIYRSNNEEGTYEKIGTTSNTYYSDTDVLPATTYWYKVSGSNLYAESQLSVASNATSDILRYGIASIMNGDSNGDGNVDVGDAIKVLKYIVGLENSFEQQQLQAANVSGDSGVDVGDALLILQKIVGLITKFPIDQ